jgi:hypothetical protein
VFYIGDAADARPGGASRRWADAEDDSGGDDALQLWLAGATPEAMGAYNLEKESERERERESERAREDRSRSHPFQ